MKLRRMQVKNFRCVEDSTEFSISPVTAFVGKNGAGKTSLLEAIYKLNPDVEELANFDVLMEYPRARRREYQKQPNREPDDALITTWELEDKDVDIVSVATPNHWHALISIWACQAGKDVYVEKPISVTVEEGRIMVEAARKYNRVVQVGTMQRSGDQPWRRSGR